MNKVWFVFRGDHHLGPFSPREIMLLYEEGKITADTPLWCEGDNGWRALRLQERLWKVEAPRSVPVAKSTVKAKVATLKKAEELPPLPPLPAEAPPDIPPTPKPVEKAPEPVLKQEEVSDFDPEVETEVALESPFSEQKPLPENEEIHELEDFYEEEASARTFKATHWACAGASVLAIIFLCYQFFMTSVGPFSWGGSGLRRLVGLSSDVQEQLYRFARENEGEFKVALALGNRGQSIWLSSGLAGEGDVELVLASKSGEILGKSEVLVKSRAPYFGKAALFENFKYLKGQNMVPGRYRAYVHYYANGFWDGVRSRLGLSELSRTVEFDYLYYLGAAADFEGVLAAFQQKNEEAQKLLNEEKLAPLHMKLEYYVTLKELGEKLMTLYEASLGEMKSGNQMSIFTSRYAREIEPLFRPLTLESKARMEDPTLTDGDRKEWNEIHMFYRSLGDLVSDMQTMTSRRKTLNPDSKERLLRIFNARTSEIVSLCSEKISAFQNQIEGG